MSSSVTLTETTWPSLIGDFVNRLNFYERTAISNEDEYREALQKLCKDPRFYNGIRRQHAQITDFTKAIDECCELKSPPTLNTLVLQLIVKVVQVCISGSKRIALLGSQSYPARLRSTLGHLFAIS